MPLTIGLTDKAVIGFGTTTTSAGGTSNAADSTFVIGVFTAAARTINTPTDSKSNVYSSIAAAQTYNSALLKVQLFQCVNGVGGASHTFTATIDANDGITAFIVELRGVVTAAALDAAVTAFLNDTSSPFEVTSGTLSQVDEVLISFIGSNGGGTASHVAGGSFTLQQEEANGGSNYSAAVATRIVSAGGTYTPSWTRTASTDCGVYVIGFKAPTGAPVPTYNPARPAPLSRRLGGFRSLLNVKDWFGASIRVERWFAEELVAATGPVNITGTFASTLANTALAATGTLDDRGTFASTLGNLTMTATGIVSDPGVFASTLGNAVLAASGQLSLPGAFASTLAGAVLAATGLLVDPGVFATTLGNDVLAASGTVGAGTNVTGTLDTTLGGATMAASGALTVTGAFTATLGNDVLAAAGQVAANLTGPFASTLADSTLSATGFVGTPPAPGSVLQTQRLMIALHF